jgi:hypothetical protein
MVKIYTLYENMLNSCLTTKNHFFYIFFDPIEQYDLG